MHDGLRVTPDIIAPLDYNLSLKPEVTLDTENPV